MNKQQQRQIKKKVFFVLQKITDVEVIEASAQLAYYLVIAIISLIAVGVSLTSRIQGLGDKLLLLLEPLFPQDIFNVFVFIIDQINIPDNNSIIFFTGISAIWFSSRCILSIRRGINKIYGLESTHSTIHLRIFTFILSLGLAVTFLLLLVLVVLGEKIGIFLFDYLNVSRWLKPGYTIIRYIIPTGFMFLYLSIIYRFGPIGGEKWRNIFPGALFSSVITTILSTSFSFYVNNMNTLSRLLGSLQSIFIFLIWIYWSCIIIFIGAAFNTGISEISKPYASSNLR